MLSGLYVVYDRVAEEAGPVFQSKNDGTAIRAFRSLTKDAPAPASEYKLLRVGMFNNDPVGLDSVSPPVEINVLDL